MRKLSYEDELMSKLPQEVFRDLEGEIGEKLEPIDVDVAPISGQVRLKIGEGELYITPEQAVDLMFALRRAVVRVKPAALRKDK